MRQVVLVDFPLRVASKAYQHREALLREFAIIAIGGGEQADVPKRLLEIATVLDDRYSGLNPEADQAVETAFKSGAQFVDLRLQVPDRIKTDTIDIAPLLIEVEEYCKNGDLLTLETPDEVRAFWIWFLVEFVRQHDGEAPLSWREFAIPPGS
jgi:hypothetical protein